MYGYTWYIISLTVLLCITTCCRLSTRMHTALSSIELYDDLHAAGALSTTANSTKSNLVRTAAANNIGIVVYTSCECTTPTAAPFLALKWLHVYVRVPDGLGSTPLRQGVMYMSMFSNRLSFNDNYITRDVPNCSEI